MTNYDVFFLKSRRLNSQKPIALVKSDQFAAFIDTIAKDESMDKEYRAFIICSISGGLRVEECLSLTRDSFMVMNGGLYFQSNVLKKRRKDQRWCRVHPNGKALVEEVIGSKIGTLFDWTQGTALVRAKRYFKLEGVCSHSFRHSAVSYFLFEERLTNEQAGKLIHINSKVVENYAHLDERATLARMFK